MLLIMKLLDWLKMVDDIKWWSADELFLPSDEAPYVVHKTKNEVDHNLGGVYYEDANIHIMGVLC